MTNSSLTLVGSPPDPLYDPLPPSVEDLLIYDQELNDECPYITFEWATHEIKNHLLNWVRVGLVADKVRYYKLWQGKFANWSEYCHKVLGKASWQIKKTIEAAKTTLYLARAGFDVLPTCEAQASKLAKFTKLGDDLITAWHKVLDAVPKHLITANAIGEVFGEEPKKQRLNIPTELYQRLKLKAQELGISLEKLLEEFLEEDEQPDQDRSSSDRDCNSAKGDRSVPDHQNKMEHWQTDLEQICREYDLKNWLSLTWLKLLVPN